MSVVDGENSADSAPEFIGWPIPTYYSLYYD